MSNIYEGKTTNEAIEKGLKDLKVSKNQVEIKVLDSDDKRSFFSILTPRVVKVEIKVKDNVKNNEKSIVKKKREKPSEENVEKSKIIVENFLKDFVEKLPTKDIKYNVKVDEGDIIVDMNGTDTGYLIGYRGAVLNSIQTILNNIINKDVNQRVRILLNIGGYKEKREEDLRNLADKIAGSVIRNRKSITLEPMTSYERKIIHTKLQDNNKVETYSVGEEPNRKIVVSLKK